MKKKLSFLAVAMIFGAWMSNVWAQPFHPIQTETGQTLYFRVTFDSYAILTYPRSPDGYYNGEPYYYVPEMDHMHMPDSADSVRIWSGHVKPTGNLVIPDSVTYQGIRYPVTKIDPWTFYGCDSLTSVVIPNSVTEIGYCAFSYCRNMTSVNIPTTLNWIESFLFYDCSSLTSITIPAAVTYFGPQAFEGCTSLSTINMFPETAPGGWFSNSFQNIAPDAIFYIPCGSYNSYNQLTSQHQVLEPDVEGISVVVGVNEPERGNANIVLTHGVEITCDSTATVEAVANDGYRFDHWSDGSTDNPYTLHLDGDSSVTAIFRPDEYQDICMVTVKDGHNVLYWNKEFETAGYTLYREGNVSGEYERLTFVPFDSLSAYVDETSHPVSRSYRYKISYTDIYDNWESEPSYEHKTMHLTINQGLGNTWNLMWDPYEGADYSTYIIYRGTDGDNLQQIDVMPADGNISYTDANAPAGDVYYQVGVIMDNPCNPTKAVSISLSNIATNGNEGIGDVNIADYKICAKNGCIVVEGADGMIVTLYDAAGRTLAIKQSSNQTTHFDVPASGTYLVKVGTAPARRIVVVR